MSNPRFFGTARIGQDNRSVLILTPFIQPHKHAHIDDIDFENSLVVDLDYVNNDVGDQLTTMANNFHAGEFKTLMDYFEGKSLRNSDRVLSWLHNGNHISKIPSEDIMMKGNHYTVKEVNNIIRKDMLEKQSARDIDDGHREKAREYQEMLKEQDLPDFNNPSESSDYTPPPVPPEIEQSATVAKTELTVDEVKNIHQRLVDEYNASQDKLTSAVSVVNELKGTLSNDMIDNLMVQLKQQSGDKEVKDYLIDALASQYDNIDSSYIKKNLDNAEKRKSKE